MIILYGSILIYIPHHTYTQAHKKYVESQVEDGIVKQRENRRLLPCLICLGDQPNIAMMCCNGPVHIQCMTDWLTKAPNPVCMQCREPLPRIVPSFAPPPSAQIPSPQTAPTLSSSPFLLRDIVAAQSGHALFRSRPDASSATSFRDMLGTYTLSVHFIHPLRTLHTPTHYTSYTLSLHLIHPLTTPYTLTQYTSPNIIPSRSYIVYAHISSH